MRQDYDIVGSYDNQNISAINAERTVNLFEFVDQNAKRPKVLISTSGLKNSYLNFTPETNGARGAFVFNNVAYQVFGGSVYRITGIPGFLIKTKIGQLGTTTGYVGITANSYQLIFVDGQKGYIYDTNASSFIQITDTGFPSKPIDVAYLDGFFIVPQGESNSFRLSSLNQGLVWGGGEVPVVFTADTTNDVIIVSNTDNYQTGTPIKFSTTGSLPTCNPPINTSATFYAIRVSSITIRIAVSYADAIANTYVDIQTTGTGVNSVNSVGQIQEGFVTSDTGTIVACRTLHRRLFFFCQYFTEIWENSGIGSNLPLRRNNNLLMEVGTPAIGSVTVGFDRLFFLSQDRGGLNSVMEVKGTESIPVSNKAIDTQLATYAATTGVNDATGILIKENGMIFYRLNFTTSNHTFILNVSMSTVDNVKWHEEEVLNGDRHPAQTQFYLNGTNYYGAYNQATLFIVDSNVSTNEGEAIRRMRIGRQITPPGYNRTRIDRFQLDLLQGQVPFTDTVTYLITQNNIVITTENDIPLSLDEINSYPSSQNPKVFLQASRDGGQTYGTYFISTMGKLGERTYRTVWRKLGTIPRGQGFTPKIEFFSDIQFIILGSAWDFEVLPE